VFSEHCLGFIFASANNNPISKINLIRTKIINMEHCHLHKIRTETTYWLSQSVPLVRKIQSAALQRHMQVHYNELIACFTIIILDHFSPKEGFSKKKTT
jgi:hypothetical protein